MKKKYTVNKPEIKERIQFLIEKKCYSDLFDLVFALLKIVDDMRVNPEEKENDFAFGLRHGYDNAITDAHNLLIEVLEEIHDAERKAMEDR